MIEIIDVRHENTLVNYKLLVPDFRLCLVSRVWIFVTRTSCKCTKSPNYTVHKTYSTGGLWLDQKAPLIPPNFTRTMCYFNKRNFNPRYTRNWIRKQITHTPLLWLACAPTSRLSWSGRWRGSIWPDEICRPHRLYPEWSLSSLQNFKETFVKHSSFSWRVLYS